MALRLRTRAEVDATFRLVHSEDPAIDTTEVGRVMRYRGTELNRGHWDVEELLFREGCEPTFFVCRPLSARAAITCDAHESDNLKYWWAFRFSIEEIHGMLGPERWEPEWEQADGGKLLKPASAFDFGDRIGMDVPYEIGKGILTRAHLPNVEKKDSAPSPGSDKKA